jgi:hypothetical protein
MLYTLGDSPKALVVVKGLGLSGHINGTLAIYRQWVFFQASHIHTHIYNLSSLLRRIGTIVSQMGNCGITSGTTISTAVPPAEKSMA